ncbi:Gfo/Idh/MocA family oxidoreductase [Deinococcus rubellus]|uniref:Gfo/Idh/MocA family oxidoreductase n=1 Tax=Deinococcus rubellus TaxID=1889240 RepID=A0ABY5YIL7_9DEIO|nr:Gfo/Idh/MocA family oxidoreductase [Deinococcus rubellus]UWX63638.1 Gfo/Idh/MocA family oxidoreductase [Deinococcus rubellus]
MPNKPDISNPEPQQRRVGFAVVGLGELSAEELIPALRTSQHAYLAAVVTGEPAKGKAFARAAGLTENDAYTYEQFDDLAKRGDVQAIYIVLPNNLHREYTERAAKMGKHVLCEKPLAANTEDAEAMVAACKNAGVKLMAAYRIQYTPHHWAAKRAIAAGKLGKIKLLDSIHTQVEDDASVWRLSLEQAGGGPLVDVGIYCLNTLRFLIGLEPEWVYAATHQPQGDERFREVEESMSVMLGFPGGLIANILTSYGATKTDTVRVLGEDGSVLLDPAFVYSGLELELSDKQAKTRPQFPAYDQFTLEVDHFAECIRQDRQPYTSGEEGVQDHRLMDAIYQSARSGQRVKVEKFSGQDIFRNAKNEPELPGNAS